MRGNPKVVVFSLSTNKNQPKRKLSRLNKEMVMRVSKAMWAMVLGAGLTCGSSAALAQAGTMTKSEVQEDKSSADAHLQAMAKQLNLTDEQKEKLKPILTSQLEEITALKNGPALTPPQKRAKMMEIGEKYRPQINAILTPEQQAKWKAMKQEAMEKHKGEMGGGGGMDHQ
jgi:Spy/CpxP family protein refolding chaperone